MVYKTQKFSRFCFVTPTYSLLISAPSPWAASRDILELPVSRAKHVASRFLGIIFAYKTISGSIQKA